MPASSPPLRKYQEALLAQIPSGLGRRTLLQLEVAGGKTRISVEWARLRNPTTDRPLWFVVHRIELLRQALDEFIAAGFEPGLIASGVEPTPHAPIQICTIQTITRRTAETPPAYLVFDEAHHVTASSWAALLGRYPNTEVLGLSATPCRMDAKPLGKYFDHLLVGPSMRELQNEGFLSPFVMFHGHSPDLNDIDILAGDYSATQLAKTVETTMLVAKPWDQWRRRHLRGPALAFAPNIASSKRVAGLFNEHGISAVHIDFETPAEEREALLDKWQGGGIELLSSVSIFAEGLNVPHLTSVYLMRPTMSLGFYRQMVGRALRPSPDGRPVMIFDHAGCAGLHGLPDTEVEWSLAKEAKEAKKPSQPLHHCEECSGIFEGGTVCPHCGHVHEHKERNVILAAGRMRLAAGPPEGCISIAEYARRIGKSSSVIRHYRGKGMPSVGAWINPEEADAWNEARKIRVRAAQAVRAKTQLKKMWKDPAYREAVSARAKAMNEDPAFRAAHSVRMRKLHDNPAFEAANIERTKARHADPAFKAALSERFKAKNADPAFKAARSEKIKKRWADPAVRAAQSERMKTQWADPGSRAKLLSVNRRGIRGLTQSR